MSRETTASLSDDLIFRGAVIALSDLRRTAEDHPKYGAYRAAAVAWTNEAQDRLSAPRRQPMPNIDLVKQAASDLAEIIRDKREVIPMDVHAELCLIASYLDDYLT